MNPSPRGPIAALTNALMHELRLFWLALQFLTRVPVPAWVGWQPEWMPASMRHFPLVGALVGLFGAAVLALASAWCARKLHKEGDVPRSGDTCPN